MNTLENQLQELEARKIALFDQGNADPVEVSRINEQIKEIKSQQVKEQAIEEKVEAEAVPFAVAGIDFTGLEAEEITLINVFIKADRRRIYAEHAAEIDKWDTDYKALSEAYKEFEADAKAEQTRLRTENDDLWKDVESLRKQVQDEQFMRQDAESKRDAAVIQAEGYKRDAQDLNNSLIEEVRRLKSEIEDYQKAKVFGERESQEITDVTPSEKDEITAALEAIKKKKYTERENWGPVDKIILPDGTYKVVPRSEVEAEWEQATVEPPAMPGGSDDSVSFPEPPTDREGDTQVPASVPAEVTDFRTEESAAAELDEHTAVQSGDAEAPETFEEAVKRRLDNLERVVYSKPAQEGTAA